MENLSDKYDSWHIPQRQSPAAIIIMLMKTAFNLLKIAWPVLILIFLKKKNDETGSTVMLIVLGFCIVAVIDTILSFWFYRFHIDNNNFILNKGWLHKKALSIPIQNIHAVNLEQSLWQQLFNVTKLTLDSSGSEKMEVKIHALPIKKAELLKQLLLSNSESKIPDTHVINNALVHKLNNADLLKLSLSANHLEAFVILLGLSLNALDDIKRIFSFDEVELIRTYSGKIINQTFFVAGIVFIIVAVVSVITSIIRTILKYYNFNVEDNGNTWKISFGLFTNHQKILPYGKIQILSWRANWLRRKIDFWILHVQSIGHDETKRKQHIQIPVTSLKTILSLVPVYQQSTVVKPGEGLQIEPAYWKRKTLIMGLPITLLLFGILYLWIGIWSITIILFFIYFGWHAYKWYKIFRWHVNEEGLQIYSGMWGRKFTLLTWKKVQQIQLNQNLYQRSHHLATINFITAGGNVELPYIKYDTAKQLADYVLYLVESKNGEWM
jgi:putative membrane protein